MSIRNATIAMRKRKIELFEQERIALVDQAPQRSGRTSSKSTKKSQRQPKKANSAFGQDN